MTLRIGTRGSRLALAQTRLVADALAEAHPGLACELVRITTTGDRRSRESLPDIGGKGLFTEQIERALLDGAIDLAVHSLKDLPVDTPPGLLVAAVPERAPANDVLVSRDGRPLRDLAQGACVGTSSLRRSAQMLRARPDLRIEPIRGNVDTRLGKVQDGAYDATLLALAGLVRLGLAEQATEILPFDTMLPAPGQGALALEARADDARMLALLGAVHHAPTALAASCERAVLRELGGGCSLPLGALAEATDGAVRVRAILLSPDGATVCVAEAAGSEPAEPARAVAGELRRQGADRILEDL